MSVDQYKEEGNQYFAEKKYEEAVESYSKAIELDPTNHILFSNRAGSYSAAGNHLLALQDAEQCIKLQPNWPKGYRRKIHAYLGLGNISGAEEVYKQVSTTLNDHDAFKGTEDEIKEARVGETIDVILQKDPFRSYTLQDPTYRPRLIKIIYGLEKNPNNFDILRQFNFDTRVAEFLTQFMGAQMKNGSGMFTPPKSYMKENEADKAAQTKKKAEEDMLKNRSPEEIEADELKNQGNQFYKKKEFKEALDAYSKAAELCPHKHIYLFNKSAVYYEMEDYDTCIKVCEDLIKRRYDLKIDFDKAAKIYARMACCYTKKLDYGKAIEMYEKALTEDNNRKYRSSLREVKDLKLKKEEEDYFDDEKAEEHRLQGNDYFKAQRYPDAKKEYDEGIRRNPKDARLYANRAAALMKLSELGMALKDVEKSLDLDPKVPKVWARKGNIQLLMKQYNQALTSFQSGLDIDPKSTECESGMYRTIEHINMCASSEDIDEEQVRNAMRDPEIQKILSDPQMAMILKSVTENPSMRQEAFKDPKVAQNFAKLVAAGFVRMAA